MQIISAPRYAGKTTRAIDLVRRLNDIEGNKAVLVTVNRKEGEILHAQYILKHPPISIDDMLSRSLRGQGITHVVIDGLDRWLHRHLESRDIVLAGLTINEDTQMPAPALARVARRRAHRDPP